MPIANVVLRPDLPSPGAPPAGLVELWCRAADMSAEHVTVNILTASAQLGARCDVMAFLHLPTAWPAAKVAAIQLGLAEALGEVYAADPSQVHVVTSMVPSGHVVAGGEIETW